MESTPASPWTLHYVPLLSDLPLSTYPAISSLQTHCPSIFHSLVVALTPCSLFVSLANGHTNLISSSHLLPGLPTQEPNTVLSSRLFAIPLLWGLWTPSGTSGNKASQQRMTEAPTTTLVKIRTHYLKYFIQPLIAVRFLS